MDDGAGSSDAILIYQASTTLSPPHYVWPGSFFDKGVVPVYPYSGEPLPCEALIFFQKECGAP